MAKVTIDRHVKGRPMNDYIAHTPGVSSAIDDETRDIASKAQAILDTHRDTGNSKITIGKGILDGWIYLDDTGDAEGMTHQAAWAINQQIDLFNQAVGL